MATLGSGFGTELTGICLAGKVLVATIGSFVAMSFQEDTAGPEVEALTDLTVGFDSILRSWNLPMSFCSSTACKLILFETLAVSSAFTVFC